MYLNADPAVKAVLIGLAVKPDSAEKYRFTAFSRAISHSQVNIERIV
jgi:hypothetical protein